MKIEDKIERLLPDSEVDDRVVFEDELLNIKRMMKVTDSDIMERCGEILKGLRKNKVEIPEGMSDGFASALKIFETDYDEFPDDAYDEDGQLKPSYRKKKSKKKKAQHPNISDDPYNSIDIASSEGVE